MPASTARCPDDNTLGLLIAGELPDGERATVERHLGGCPACAQLIAEYARTTPRRSVPERYQLIRQLGAGAMGEVWEADDTALGRRVALKFLRPGAAPGSSVADREYQARMVREARALARLRHANVVAVYDLEQAGDGELFLALELVDGTSARQWQAAAPRSLGELLGVWRQVADGLSAVHRAGIVHRDLKPDNVLIARDGRVVLGDFGLASMAADGGSPTLTATGQIVGTPLYMPLEQLRGEPAGARSDQFALCVCLWEAITGERPFGGGSVAALIGAMRTAPITPRRHRRLLRVLARGLDPDPAVRWPDIAMLAAALDRAQRAARTQRIGRAVLVAAAAATAIAGAAIAAR